MTSIVIVIDDHGIIESMNPSTLSTFGYEASELVGESVNILMPSAYREAHDGYLKTYRDAKKSTIFRIGREVEAQRKDGSMFPVHVSVGQMELGEERLFVGIVRDITAQKDEEAIRNDLLVDLKRSNADLEKFAYVASHDLQEPLRMVASYTGLLAEEYEGQLSEEADEYIHFAVDGAKRMQQLIQELLKYSRIGQISSEFEETSSDILLEEVVGDLQIAIEQAGAEVLYDNLPTISGDPTLLRQLFQNLIANAIKFRTDAPPKIEVDAKREDEMWVFSVRDNGIGFDMKFQDRVFDIFQRLHTRKEYEGSGMGLSICKRIAHRHGGRMWVESTLGAGTTFYFTVADPSQ